MPLRDHFRAPFRRQLRWESFHSAWINTIVRDLNGRCLPPGYRAEPRTHAGSVGQSETANDLDVFEALVHDDEQTSVAAAIELVTLGQKESKVQRHAIVTQCTGYLRNGMSLVMIDIVTEGRANIFAALMGSLGAYATPGGCDGAQVCAASLRIAKKHMQVWSHVLEVGAELPTLPLWLSEDLSVPLELERTYEETCQVLRLT